jgi:hypothetical protein
MGHWWFSQLETSIYFGDLNHGYPKPGFQDQFEELSSIKAAVRIKVPALRVRRADIESMVKYQLRILAGEKSEHSMNMAMGQDL